MEQPHPEPHRPHVLLSVAMSIDGHIDDTTPARLLLSNAEDFDRVDETRANCDAIMIGAETIRRDNPRLLVNSPERREARVATGQPEYPLKATITASGELDPTANFFTTGGEKVVYCATATTEKQRTRFAGTDGVGNPDVTVVAAGDPPTLETVLEDLASRGVKRLMVEGGTSLHTRFLTSDLVDEIHLAIAPFFVGDAKAPTFVGEGAFPQNPNRRMFVDEVRQVGDIVFVRYVMAREA